MNWKCKVDEIKEDLIQDTQQFLHIKSVKDVESATKEMPMGKGVHEALMHLLQKGQEEGFTVKNVDGYAGHIEYGQGEELVGILCHVDVVPEGEGWTTPPYSAAIRDDKIFARGAIDDKGPTMAAFYALKLVKDAGLPLSKRVRIIIGTDEESDWECVDHYFKHEEMPTVGFAPDADFPIIFAEKGISDFFVQTAEVQKQEGDFVVKSIQSGYRPNMVPDYAKAIIETSDASLHTRFKAFLANHELQGEATYADGTYELSVKGVSVHGMEPEKGINAGIKLATFLQTESLTGSAKTYIEFITTYCADSRGRAFGVNFVDEETGDLTINYGIFRFEEANGGRVSFNLRYPVRTNFEKTMEMIEAIATKYSAKVVEFKNSRPHYVPKTHPLIETLQRVYENETGLKADLLTIGGGTYARSLEFGVAFGPLFPGKEETAHQRDEYIEIDDLIAATAIYAAAIYELAK